MSNEEKQKYKGFKGVMFKGNHYTTCLYHDHIYTIILRRDHKLFNPNDYTWLKNQKHYDLMFNGVNGFMREICGVALPAINLIPKTSDGSLYNLYRANGIELLIETPYGTIYPPVLHNKLLVVDKRSVNPETDKFFRAELADYPDIKIEIATKQGE